VHERRRLLQRLEQLVGRLLDQRVGVLEHEDASGRLERRHHSGRHDRLLDVPHQHLVRTARHDPGQVGMRAVLHARAHAGGIGRPFRQQRGGERARRRALAAAGRAVEEIGVGGLAARSQRRPERRAGVRVVLGARQVGHRSSV
jgi:hypothetical protein